MTLQGAHPATGAGYAAVTVLAGLTAAAAGIAAATGWHRRRPGRSITAGERRGQVRGFERSEPRR